MPKSFNVCLIQPSGYIHSLAFYETGLLLQFSLQSLGFECSYQTNQVEPHATNILLGYNVVDDANQIPDCEYIVYQLEQLSEKEGWFKTAYMEIFRRAAEIWDYSTENIAFLRSRGLSAVRHLPFGFHERLESIAPTEPDIDILFYGGVNVRRQKILEALAQHFRVHVLTGCYGPERDVFIARSKMVLNIHFYEAQIMEQPRVSYLLNNKRFVLSEESPVNPYRNALAVADYASLTEAAAYWLAHPQLRLEAAQMGYDFLRRHPMIENLRSLMTSASSSQATHGTTSV